jgi:hypothetical protein
MRVHGWNPQNSLAVAVAEGTRFAMRGAAAYGRPASRSDRYGFVIFRRNARAEDNGCQYGRASLLRDPLAVPFHPGRIE